MTMTEIQEFLGGLMRAIDKKTVLTTELRSDPERPGVTVRLSRDKRVRSLEISDSDLVAAQTDLMRRNRVRTALKHAYDRMWQETGPVSLFSTKTENQKGEGNSWFRNQSGGRGGRR